MSKEIKALTYGGLYWVQRFIKEIDYTKCSNCGFCVKVCPAAVFKFENQKVILANKEFCRGCEVCERMCKVKAITCLSIE